MKSFSTKFKNSKSTFRNFWCKNHRTSFKAHQCTFYKFLWNSD